MWNLCTTLKFILAEVGITHQIWLISDYVCFCIAFFNLITNSKPTLPIHVYCQAISVENQVLYRGKDGCTELVLIQK